MLVKSHKTLNGNDQYEGFCVDLIKELSAMNNNFNINFILSKDGSSGSPIVDSKKRPPEWSGMLGSILRGVRTPHTSVVGFHSRNATIIVINSRKEADLACADLTVTREREEVVDFTAVFMNLGE